MDILDPRSRHRLERIERFRMARREALEHEARDLAMTLRRGEPARGARRSQLPAHVPSSNELGRVEVDREAVRLSRRGRGEQLGVRVWSALLFPLAPEFLEHPHPRAVLEEA